MSNLVASLDVLVQRDAGGGRDLQALNARRRGRRDVLRLVDPVSVAHVNLNRASIAQITLSRLHYGLGFNLKRFKLFPFRSEAVSILVASLNVFVQRDTRGVRDP